MVYANCFRSLNCDGDPVRANSKNLEAVLTALRRAGVEDDVYTIHPSSRALSLAAVYARARKVCL